MELKRCPKCKRYSVSFDFGLGIERCRWIDCNWVNCDCQELPVAYRTSITTRKKLHNVNANATMEVSL